jgi:acetyl-CoA carboxylase carboxyltransferase component
MDDACDTERQHVFGYVGKPKSKWAKADREMVERTEANAGRARESYEFHQTWEHHDVGTRVERIVPETLEEMRNQSFETEDKRPSKKGVVTATGHLNGKQTVAVTFDDGTFGASNSYADEFRKLG